MFLTKFTRKMVIIWLVSALKQSSAPPSILHRCRAGNWLLRKAMKVSEMNLNSKIYIYTYILYVFTKMKKKVFMIKEFS
jgi:hypothetical protein